MLWLRIARFRATTRVRVRALDVLRYLRLEQMHPTGMDTTTVTTGGGERQLQRPIFSAMRMVKRRAVWNVSFRSC